MSEMAASLKITFNRIRIEYKFLVLIFIFLFSICLRNPLIVGGDEGMEFAKALALEHHIDSVEHIWNDQPWFYSQILQWLWKIGNHTWIAPRLLSIVCFIASIVAMLAVLDQNISSIAKIVSITILCLWDTTLTLACSAMQEMPAFALTICGIAIIARATTKKQWYWLLGGGLLGFGASIKLTSLLYFPGIFALLLIQVFSEVRLTKCRPNLIAQCYLLCKPLLLTGLGITSAFFVAAWASPMFDWDLIWNSHRSASANMTSEAKLIYNFSLGALGGHPGIILLALLGVLILKEKVRRGPALFTIISFCTVTIIHLLHRPFWGFYMFHFAFPLALLAGWGVEVILRIFVGNTGNVRHIRDRIAGARFQFYAVSSITICALIIGFESFNFVQTIKSLFNSETATNNLIVKALTKKHGQIDIAFADDPVYLAHANIAPIPELTVVSKKRYWSGALDDKRLLAILIRNEPEAIILNKSKKYLNDWKQFINKRYILVAEDINSSLFFSEELNPQELPSLSERLKVFGL